MLPQSTAKSPNPFLSRAGCRARAGAVHLLRRCRHHLQCTQCPVPHLRRRQAAVCICSSRWRHKVKNTVEQCVAAIKDWCVSRRLQLNDGKTEAVASPGMGHVPPPSSLMHAPIFPYSLGKRIVFFLLPEAFCGLKYAENAIAAGAPTRTPLGELTTLPHTP